MFQIYVSLFITVSSVLCNRGNKTDVSSFFKNNQCAVTYQYRDLIKPKLNCTEVREINDLCGRNINVIYFDVPPYIYTGENKSIQGTLPGRYFYWNVVFSITLVMYIVITTNNNLISILVFISINIFALFLKQN